jgi:membrane protease YdiL (CAAX protease family)
MSDEVNDPVLIAFAGGVMLLSAAACFGLFVAWLRAKSLPFVPRQLVPWNAAGAVLAVLLVAITLLTVVVGLDEAAEPVKESTSITGVHLVAGMAQEVFLIGGFLLFIAIYFKASRTDLGLPTTKREFLNDLVLGIIAGIATLLPVRIVQTIALKVSGAEEIQSGHPLVKMLTEGDVDVGVLVLASFAAVVIAPICEEVTFRLLLQGWLEKWEANAVGCVAPPVEVVTSPEPEVVTANAANDEARMTNDEIQCIDHSSVEPSPPTLAVPPVLGIAGMPFSWLPIGISSALFGLAHFGYGPEPIPLFFLALVLGYMYYRTHRIVPSIIAHAVFNLFTMVILWRMVLHGAKPPG